MMGAYERFKLLADEESFEETEANLISTNPLGFENYKEKTATLREKTGLKDAVVTGRFSMNGHPTMAAVLDFKCCAG